MGGHASRFASPGTYRGYILHSRDTGYTVFNPTWKYKFRTDDVIRVHSPLAHEQAMLEAVPGEETVPQNHPRHRHPNRTGRDKR